MRRQIDKIDCHLMKLYRTAMNVQEYYDSFIAPAGISSKQFTTLRHLSFFEGCSTSELAEHMYLSRSTLSRNLKPLFTAGLIADLKEPGARDSILTLTEKGKAVYEEATALWEKAQQAYTEKLGEETLRSFEGVLDKLQDILA